MKQSILNRVRVFFWHQRAKYSLRQLERELDRRAAGIKTAEEQRAEIAGWLKEERKTDIYNLL
jgi:hypothetical protein